MNKKPLVIIGGATGVGKTALSVKLAQMIGGEVISADSMQVYKGFDIGTAKIRPEETQGVPHFLIDELEPDDEFNVYEFKHRALKYAEKIWERGHIPIIVGGTGFYIQALLYDIDFTDEETDKSYRHELEQLAEEKGAEYLHDMLNEVDPESASAIHRNNVKRVIRALEFFHETGAQMSSHNTEQRQKESPYNYAYLILNRKRDVIYKRIEDRVDLMMDEGLADEVKWLLDSGISPDSLAMQGLGYKEIADYILCKCSLDEAVYKLKLNTRHFAKRQITWFKREKDAIWVNYEDFAGIEEMTEHIINILKEKDIV
ncbi:MAG: tRNA (adenosine(37)-N6)-dimethylallyltransferase MiaA [Lachnospiraceae bacterium]|nr:tRNA (adenosine(37)-N6)-dimethylallyltransferase MiaA [Lachnospiraceae bacterium]